MQYFHFSHDASFTLQIVAVKEGLKGRIESDLSILRKTIDLKVGLRS